jgi:hypothetical protein
MLVAELIESTVPSTVHKDQSGDEYRNVAVLFSSNELY